MRQSEGRECARSDGTERAPATQGMMEQLLSVIAVAAAPGPAERAYKASVEAAAGYARGPVSLWRYGDGDPALAAFMGAEDSQLDEGLLSAMKETAAASTERFAGQDWRNWTVPRQASESERRLAAVPVRTCGGIWGAMVFRMPEDPEVCVAYLEALSGAAGLAADRESLCGEVLALRGRLAASESTRNPDDRYAMIGQLSAHAYAELDAILKAVCADLQRQGRAGTAGVEGGSVAELGRARDIVAEQLELARLEMPVLEMESLNVVIQESLRETEDRIQAKQLRLIKRLGPDLPEIMMDREKVKVAVRKVLGAAVARSCSEGWLRVETAANGGEVRLQVTWEEKAAPGEAADDMFVPFGRLDRGGAGFAVASQIIREHGGGVWVQRFESGSTALVLDFPIELNQDRRHRQSRRSGLDRRRPKGL